MEPFLVQVDWENGDITVERVIAVTLDDAIYTLDEGRNGNFWCYKSMTKHYIPPVDIKIGEHFTVEGKKYIVALPQTATQTDKCNDHGHIVITLFDMD
jgi:hypothetical protein